MSKLCDLSCDLFVYPQIYVLNLILPNPLEFMNRGRGSLMEFFKVSYASLFTLYNILLPSPKQLQNHYFNPWGNSTKFSPNAIKLSKVTSNT